jgi:hypothetical protein
MPKQNVNRECTPAGWRLDHDHWYVRKMRPGDVEFDECSVGFTHKGIVYLRRAQQCSDYDVGLIATAVLDVAPPAPRA